MKTVLSLLDKMLMVALVAFVVVGCVADAVSTVPRKMHMVKCRLSLWVRGILESEASG
jgi:nitrate reductase gamma subunit